MKQNWLVILIIALVFFSAFAIEKVNAGSGDNVSGWAWSENIGWINFNCVDREAATGKTCLNSNNPAFDSAVNLADYGVNIDPSGNFSGYAWAENIGWIRFDPPSPYPRAPDYSARVNLANNKVSGWARALAYDGGWDGWIKLSKSTGAPTYEVSLNTTPTPDEFEGWAWGSDVVGWISFNVKNCDIDKDGTYEGSNEGAPAGCPTSGTAYDYKVVTFLNQPPSVKNVQLGGVTYCGISSGVGQVGFRWKYQDPEGDSQSKYHLQVATGSGFTNKAVDCEIPQSSVVSGEKGTSSVKVVPNPSSDLCGLEVRYDMTYYWRVRVQDDSGSGIWSEWGAGPDFDTPLHPYPWPNFTCNDQDNCPAIQISEGEVVALKDISIDYSGEGIVSRLWALPAKATLEPGYNLTNLLIKAKFKIKKEDGQLQLQQVTLEVTDSDGYYCESTENLNVLFPLPKWREIPPVTTYLGNFLAKVSEIFRLFFMRRV